MKGSYAVRHLLFHMSTPTAARVHLLISGCTLLAARRMLFALGAARVSAFVTHAAFGHSNETLDRLLQREPRYLLNKDDAPTSVDGHGFARLGNGGRIVWT
eukprot:scaffold23595_cov18-Tisochrysis_lutea.AAC.1